MRSSTPFAEELQEVVETLAAIPRPSASEGEARAAHWIAERLRSHGCDVQVDVEPAYGDFWKPLFALNVLGVAAGALTLRRGREVRALPAGPFLVRGARGTSPGPVAARRLRAPPPR